jgi:hypothetical protein
VFLLQVKKKGLAKGVIGISRYLIEVHQFLSIHLLGLVQRGELDVLGRVGLIGEGTLDGIQVVGTN